MPSQFLTFRSEFNHRAASVYFFVVPRGDFPWRQSRGLALGGLVPDLVKIENRVTFAILVKF